MLTIKRNAPNAESGQMFANHGSFNFVYKGSLLSFVWPTLSGLGCAFRIPTDTAAAGRRRFSQKGSV